MANCLPILTHDFILVGPKEKPVPNVSVGQFLLESLRKAENLLAVVDAITEESITYADILHNTAAVTEWLRSKGLRPGDSVAICSENRFEMIYCVLACIMAGVTCAPLNPIYSVREIEHAISISDPTVVFSSPLALSKVEEAIQKATCVKFLVSFIEDENPKIIPFTRVLETKVDIGTFKATPVDWERNVAVVLCSSGTTGLPKGVELTHKNLMHLLVFGTDERTQFTSPKDVALGLIPIFHGYGLSLMLMGITRQVKVILMALFDEEVFLEAIQKFKVTLLAGVPPLMVFLAKHPLVNKYDISSLRDVKCGAAPLSAEVQHAVERKLNNVVIGQGYGMTETTAICAVSPPKGAKQGSSGVVIFGNEMKVVDLDTGKNKKPFERGEICFRGPLVMKGYRKNPTATAETIDPDGWLHTGDIGYYDLDGHIYVVDRLKELIKYKGFQVPPAELEAILLTHPDVAEAGVIGIPDESAGELPRAFVVKRDGSKVTAEDLIKFVHGQVSPQKRLHGGVQFLEVLPKNPTGKILRKDLRDMYRKSKL